MKITREQFERSMKTVDDAIKAYYDSKPHTPRLLRWACMIITCGVTFLWHADQPTQWGPNVLAAVEKINESLRADGCPVTFYFETGSKHHFSLQVHLAKGGDATDKKSEKKTGGMLTRLAEQVVSQSDSTTLVHPETGHDVCNSCHTPRGVQNGMPASTCTKCGRSF